MNSNLKNYADNVPEEVKLTLKGLGDDSTLGLLVALMKNGKMSFNEMKDRFDLSSSSLNNILNVLQDGNLIQNFYEKTDERNFSYYDVTDIPEQVFDSIYDILFSSSKEQSMIIENNIPKSGQATQHSVKKENNDPSKDQINTPWKLRNANNSNDYTHTNDVIST